MLDTIQKMWVPMKVHLAGKKALQQTQVFPRGTDQSHLLNADVEKDLEHIN